MRAPLCRRLEKLEAAELAADTEALSHVLREHSDADLIRSLEAADPVLIRFGLDVEAPGAAPARALLESSEAFQDAFAEAMADVVPLAFIAVRKRRTGHPPDVLPSQAQLDRWFVGVTQRWLSAASA